MFLPDSVSEVHELMEVALEEIRAHFESAKVLERLAAAGFRKVTSRDDYEIWSDLSGKEVRVWPESEYVGYNLIFNYEVENGVLVVSGHFDSRYDCAILGGEVTRRVTVEGGFVKTPVPEWVSVEFSGDYDDPQSKLVSEIFTRAVWERKKAKFLADIAAL